MCASDASASSETPPSATRPTGVVMLGVVGSIEMLRYSGSALTFLVTAHHGAGAEMNSAVAQS